MLQPATMSPHVPCTAVRQQSKACISASAVTAPACDGIAHCVPKSTTQLDPSMRPWSFAHHSLERVHVASAPQPAPPWLAQVQSPRGLPAGPDCPPHCPHIGASAAIDRPLCGRHRGPLSRRCAWRCTVPVQGAMIAVWIIVTAQSRHTGLRLALHRASRAWCCVAINLRTCSKVELLATLRSAAAAPAHCHPLSAVLPKLTSVLTAVQMQAHGHHRTGSVRKHLCGGCRCGWLGCRFCGRLRCWFRGRLGCWLCGRHWPQI